MSTTGHDQSRRGERRVQDALAETMFRLGPVAQTVSILAGLVLAVGLSPVVPFTRLIIWYGALVASSLWRVHIVLKRRRLAESARVPGRLILEYRVGVLTSGVIWGAATLLTYPDFPLAQQALVAMVLAGMTAGAVTVLAALPRTFMLFAAPALVPAIVILLTRGTLTAAAAGLVILFFTVSMRRVERDLRQILRSNIVLSARLAEERDLELTTVEALAEGVMRISPDGRVSYMNPAAREILEVAEGAGEYAHIDRYLPIQDHTGSDVSQMILGTAVQAGHALDITEDLWLPHRRDEGRWLRILARPLKDEAGLLTEVVVVIRDTTAERAVIRELEHRATHDALTGLPNRRAMMRALERSVQTTSSGMSGDQYLLFMDLDGFKGVNDAAGHLAGDRMLVEVSSAMREVVRDQDLLARLGGDEFAILARDCDADGAQTIVDHVCEAVESVALEVDEKEYRVGVSVGIATIDGTEEPDDVVARADAACYSSKSARRG